MHNGLRVRAIPRLKRKGGLEGGGRVTCCLCSIAEARLSVVVASTGRDPQGNGLFPENISNLGPFFIFELPSRRPDAEWPMLSGPDADMMLVCWSICCAVQVL